MNQHAPSLPKPAVCSLGIWKQQGRKGLKQQQADFLEEGSARASSWHRMDPSPSKLRELRGVWDTGRVGKQMGKLV